MMKSVAYPDAKLVHRNSTGRIVLPQVVEDKSLIESFTGFIHEVVPQAYNSGTAAHESREKILWVKFEYTDINDTIFESDPSDSASGSSPLLLVLGYTSGIQVWYLGTDGEANELMCWFQGSPKIFKLLPSPRLSGINDKDPFLSKRPLAIISEGSSHTSQYSSISFISLRGGDVVKIIKFKNALLDVIVNRIAIAVTFVEKIAIFNPSTLNNTLTITTCYASPGLNLNPIALGPRWLAYSEQKLIPWQKSAGGCESEYVQSYTATVLSAAKTLGQGIKGLSESVASSITGHGIGTNFTSSNVNTASLQPGVVTIVDLFAEKEDSSNNNCIAHFAAHSDPIVAMSFDPSGMLLLTADKKGYRFHVFKIQPHLLGSASTAVHHLYVLYRGDTTARIQDIAFSIDSRWVAISSLRGTTHVFPITPYGGPVGFRTHSTPHVVNKFSRFHRSAGIASDDRHSPVPHDNAPISSSPTSLSFANPCLPPFPHPTTVNPLAQIRSYHTLLPPTRHSNAASQDERDSPMLKVAACFAASRMPDRIGESNTASMKRPGTAVDSLFVMSSQGSLIQYNLTPHPITGTSKVSDETPIELKVEAKCEWFLFYPITPNSTSQPPLMRGNPLLSTYSSLKRDFLSSMADNSEEQGQLLNQDERWLAQVEIVTHIGPHRRIWMGPQFTFKPTNANSPETELGVKYSAKSEPVNVPSSSDQVLSSSIPAMSTVTPLFIENGSCSSYEQSPGIRDFYERSVSERSLGFGEMKIQEDLADAMLESPSSLASTSIQPSTTADGVEFEQAAEDSAMVLEEKKKPKKSRKKKK